MPNYYILNLFKYEVITNLTSFKIKLLNRANSFISRKTNLIDSNIKRVF